jgi:hypothetical protein
MEARITAPDDGWRRARAEAAGASDPEPGHSATATSATKKTVRLIAAFTMCSTQRS